MQIHIQINLDTEKDDVARVLSALAGTHGFPAPAAVPTPSAPPKAKAEKKETPAAPEPAPAAITAGAPSDYVPTEAELSTAANSAIDKLGAGAQARVKEYIAATFQKDDGSPAGLRTVRADQRARLLADLNAFAAGKKVI